MARNGDPRRGDDTGTHIITKTRPKTKRPSLYKVLLLNDDYTPMDFVVYVLERFFNKPPEEATRIMCTRSFVAMLVPNGIADHLILVSRDVRLRSFIDQIEQNGNICFARSQGSKIPRHKAANIFSK